MGLMFTVLELLFPSSREAESTPAALFQAIPTNGELNALEVNHLKPNPPRKPALLQEPPASTANCWMGYQVARPPTTLDSELMPSSSPRTKGSAFRGLTGGGAEVVSKTVLSPRG